MEKDFFILTKIISEKMSARSDKTLKGIDLTFSQLRTLMVLDSNAGMMTQKEIENALQVSHNATLGLVTRLEKKGYVLSYQDEDDKRQKVVKLTDFGNEKIKTILSGKQHDFSKVLSWMSEEEYNSLVLTLNKIVDKINELD